MFSFILMWPAYDVVWVLNGGWQTGKKRRKKNVEFDANMFKPVFQLTGLIFEPARSMDLFFLLEPLTR